MRSPEKIAKLKGLDWINSPEKRALDILIAGSLLPVAVPIGAAALTASRIMDGPNPFVYQERIGRNGVPFLIRKIRSMEPIEPNRELHRTDTKISPLGQIIRPVSIDEIPQLLNIFDGSMSIVGPRAFPQVTIDGMEANLSRSLYEEWLHVYQTSRPGGISTYNIAMRSGADSRYACEEKANADIADFKNASLSHDLKLVVLAAKMGMSIISRNLKPE